MTTVPPRVPDAMNRARDTDHERPMWPVPTPTADDSPRLADALDDAHDYLTRFVAFPTPHAAIAAALWVAHAHVLDVFDSTPRLAFLSPEPGSGKSRALEAIGPLVPHPMHAVNATPAALFRSVSDLDNRPTILFDEVDTIFGPKAKDNEEVRGFLNAGHRRSGVAYRCVGLGTAQTVVPFPAFCAVAVAGLHDIPDTIATRSVIVRMRRRAPHERVDPFRARLHEPEGADIAERLADALDAVTLSTNPALPAGVTDRPADVWEPLLSIAQAAGGTWPELAESACLHFAVDGVGAREPSLAVRLLADLRDVFDNQGDPDHLPTSTILDALHAVEESPWADLRGKPLDARGLSRYLHRYEVRPALVRVGANVARGYRRADLWDAWVRYLPALSGEPVTSVTAATGAHPEHETGAHAVTHVTDDPLRVTDDHPPIRAQVAVVTDVTLPRQKAHGDALPALSGESATSATTPTTPVPEHETGPPTVAPVAQQPPRVADSGPPNRAQVAPVADVADLPPKARTAPDGSLFDLEPCRACRKPTHPASNPCRACRTNNPQENR